MGVTASSEARRRQEWLLTDHGQEWLTSKQTQKAINYRLLDLEPGAARRAQEETDSTRGERVWFSRYMWNGRLMHWALICHNTKYEFRRLLMQDNSPQDHFTCSVTPCTIEQEHQQAFTTHLPAPTVDGWVICLIGWTNKTKADIDASWSAYDSHNMFWNKCQDHLRLSSQQMLVSKSKDYPFFKDHLKERYTDESRLPQPPPKVLLAMVRRGPFAKLPHMPTTAAHFMEMYAQTPGQKILLTQMEGQIVHQTLRQHEFSRDHRHHAHSHSTFHSHHHHHHAAHHSSHHSSHHTCH